MSDVQPLKEYLKYYHGLKEPGYAVLVTGDWGSGKTFQVRNCFNKDDCHYVSLFGLESSEAVYGEILAKMDPLTTKVKKVLAFASEKSKTGFGIIGSASSTVTGMANALLQSVFDSGKLIILDDLERCQLEPRSLLGIINRLVEHHNCRVVVIAHDSELEEYFAKANEKIFGQTLKIVPQFDAAFDSFKMIHPKNFQTALEKLRPDFLELFRDGKIGSLRILRQVMADTVRFLSALSDKHRKNDEAIRELARLFIALDYEVKDCRLSQDDLEGRTKALNRYAASKIVAKLRKEVEVEKPSIVSANERYKTLDLDNNILSDKLISNMLIEGCYDNAKIQMEVNGSLFFIKAAEIRPWKKVIQFQRLPDRDLDTAWKQFDAEFEAHAITDIGELLQIFSLKFMLAANGVAPESSDEVYKSCKKYIDTLDAEEKLSGAPLPSTFETSFGGYTFWIEDAYRKHFDDLKSYIEKKMRSVQRHQYPAKQQQLLELIKASPESFFRQVCYSNIGNSEFANTPILATIEVNIFVGAWLKAAVGEWHWLEEALVSRQLRDSTEIDQEHFWRHKIVKQLELEAEKLTGLARLRLTKIVERLNKKFVIA